MKTDERFSCYTETVKSFFIAGLFGLFFTLAIIGVLSVSPLFESWQQKLDIPSTTEQSPRTTPTATSVAPASTPTVLGLQTSAESINAVTLYGLINGARRDEKHSALQVSAQLEQAASIVNAARSNPKHAETLDEQSVIAGSGFPLRTFTVLHAPSVKSALATLQFWDADVRSSLFLVSDAYSHMGLSIMCNQQTIEHCSVLLVLAS